MSSPLGMQHSVQGLLRFVLPLGLILVLLTFIPFYRPPLLYQSQDVAPQSQDVAPRQRKFQDISLESLSPPAQPPATPPSPCPPPPTPIHSPPPPSPPPPSPSPPIHSPPPPSPPRPPPPTTITPKVSTRRPVKWCDVSAGEWVRDPEAPYYTNQTCKTIQEHQNCMKYGRPDNNFLKWRWKPAGCELPHFDPVRFLELMRDKSMAFVGDSLARNQMQSLMCLLSRVHSPEDISPSADENFKRMYYSAYNFTISVFWSPFLIKAEEGRSKGPNPVVFWNLHLDVPDEHWASKIHEFHYVIISGGNWFTRPSVYYEKGKLIGSQYYPIPKTPFMSLHYPHRMAFRTAFWTLNQMPAYKGATFLRTVSPAHFENGTWDTGGDCLRTRPFRQNETAGFERTNDGELYRAQMDEFRIAREQGKRRGLWFAMLDITAAMVLRPDGHPSRYGHWQQEHRAMYNDCVHWCLPGPVDTWNDLLQMLLS